MKSLAVICIVSSLSFLHVLGQAADACGVCHSNHFAEWKESTHATSWTNERFQAQLKSYGSAEFCAACHAPAAVWQRVDTHPTQAGAGSLSSPQRTPETEYEPALADRPVAREKTLEEGVTCGSCHFVPVLSPVGTREDFVGPYHSTEGHVGKAASQFQDLRICGACHGRASADYWPNGQNPGGDFHHASSLPLQFDYQINCTGCHMPRTEDILVQLRAKKYRSLPKRQVGEHRFGTDRHAAVGDALQFELRGEGSAALLSIANSGIGHPLKVCPETVYELSLAPVNGGKTGEVSKAAFPRAAELGPGEKMEVPLPFPLPAGAKVQVKLLVTGKTGTQTEIVSKIL